jgi:hypothetical protein
LPSFERAEPGRTPAHGRKPAVNVEIINSHPLDGKAALKSIAHLRAIQAPNPSNCRHRLIDRIDNETRYVLLYDFGERDAP